MTDTFDSFIDQLIDEGDNFTNVPTKQSNAKRFPCPTCNGTGEYRGVRMHQPKSHCFSCRGLGYFKTDPRKLAANRDKARSKKVTDLQTWLDAFKEQEPALFDNLDKVRVAGTNNDFIRSLAVQLFERGGLTEKQVAAWHRGNAKLEQLKEQRKAEEAAAPQADLGPIRVMFDAAVASGHKRPTYRAEGLVINLAAAHGRNPGALYVKSTNQVYGGKLVGTTFHASNDGRAQDFTPNGNAYDALMVIAQDPLEAALRYGQRTGTCACCGRKLTNKLSVELGIGPVCRESWGL